MTANLIHKVALFAVICLAFLIAGEGVLRLFHFHEIIRYTGDPDLPFIMTPNQAGYTEIGRYPITVNSHSMRGGEVSREKPPGMRRILFLGDSVTFGDGVPEEETFVRRVEAELSARHEGEFRYEVLNGGVKGYNSEHEYRFFKGRGLPLDPDLVLVGYCVNDQMAAGSSARRMQFLSPKYDASGSLKFIRGFALYVGTYRLIRTIAGALKGLPPPYLEFIRPGEPTPRMKTMWEASAASLSKIADLCRRSGIAFGIVAFPIGPQLADGYDMENAQPQGRLRALCRELGILYIDLLEPFRAAQGRVIFFDEIHLTPYGHEIAAAEIVRRLEEDSRGTIPLCEEGKSGAADFRKDIDFYRGTGDEALPAIQEAITSGESDTRHRGVIALTYLLKPREYRDEEYRKTEQDIISMLLPLLADENADVRKNATGLLGGISWSQFPSVDPPVNEGLVKMLSDQDRTIREYAAKLLIRIGRKSAVPEELRNRPDRLTID